MHSAPLAAFSVQVGLHPSRRQLSIPEVLKYWTPAMAIEDTLRALIREELLALKQDLLVELRPTPAGGNQTPNT